MSKKGQSENGGLGKKERKGNGGSECERLCDMPMKEVEKQKMEENMTDAVHISARDIWRRSL